MKTRSFLLAAGIALAMAFTISCSEAQAAGQSDFYGVWVRGSRYFEINKEAITTFEIGDNYFKKHKYRIVKWEKETNKNFAVYTLDEDNDKETFKVSIDAYSDLHIYFNGDSYEAKKSSAAEQKELNKAIKEAAAKEAAAQKAAKAVVQRGSFSDQREGRTYKTVKIGSQTWMAENLNYNASGSKCYENAESNCQKYGRLYDWNTAMKSCPSGWHLPNGDEWQKLVDFAGGDEVAGTYLKAKEGWAENGNGTDSYGFSALPGGIGYSSGSFGNVGNYGFWWSATEYTASSAYFRNMYNSDASVLRDYGNKSYLYSVRCVQD